MGFFAPVNTIVTAQAAFLLPREVLLQPVGGGDSRNPPQDVVNSAFTGPGGFWEARNQWFNPAAFDAPLATNGFCGNPGRDTLIGPGLTSWDMSLLKTMKLRENRNLQFRAEFFNIL